MRTKTGATTAAGTPPAGTATAVTIGLWLCLAIGAVLALTSQVLTRDLDERILTRAQAAAAAQATGRQLVRSAAAALQGDEGAFAQLRGERERLQQAQAGLADAIPTAESPAVPVPPPPPAATTGAAAQDAWRAYREDADRILAAQDDLLGVRDALAAAAPRLTELGVSMAKSAELIAAAGAPAEQVLEAGWQLARIETMKSSLGSLRGTGDLTLPVGDAAKAVLGAFGASLRTLIARDGARADSPAAPALEDTARLFDALRRALDPMFELVPQAQSASAALVPMQTAADQFAAALDQLMAAAWQDPRVTRLGPLPIGPWSVPVFGALTLASALLLALRTARRREAAARRQGERAGSAVPAPHEVSDGLIDDGPDNGPDNDLAGDYEGTAEVTADQTGDAAGAAGMTVRHTLPSAIHATAARLMESAAQSRAGVLHLGEAAAVQAGQIALACGAIQALIADLDEVLRQASESAGAAAHAAAVAGRGDQTVRALLTGMAAGRGLVEEGSEIIRHAGETAQAVGVLLERLADGVEETTVLALNAVIQAAPTGEAGRGLAVFAEEVQRLAGDSWGGIRETEVLVRALQAETRAALLSQEAGGAAVVPGADLARPAGDALHEIETVCAAGAELARGVVAALQHQSRQAAALTETVQALRAITAENAQGTRGAAQSLEDLVTLAAELQRLASGAWAP